jgi:hypothetical protein
MKDLLSGRFAIALVALLLCSSCSPGDREAEPNAAPPVATSILAEDASEAEDLPSPDIVLDGTEVFELTSFSVRPLDASAAGDYGAEQGGAALSVTLSRSGPAWQFVRTHQEPGEPQNRAVHDLQLSDGLMMSPDGNVIVRGTEEGVLVLERASDTIPADYWVHYLRRN